MRYGNQDWLEIAKGLPQGGQARTACTAECSADNSQIISHNNKGYSRYCFRCQDSEFVGYGLRRIDVIERHKREREMLVAKKVALPTDYTLDVPQKASIWFYQYGISAELAKSYGIGYTESLDRVVLPVYEEDELIALQMRAVDKWRKPKYLNPAGPKVSSALFVSGETTGKTVIVEDIMSAIKVGRVHHATSILGTVMTDARAMKIARDNTEVILWLDSDAAGIKGTHKAEKQLALLGVNVRKVRTEKDPKFYSLEEIRKTIDVTRT